MKPTADDGQLTVLLFRSTWFHSSDGPMEELVTNIYFLFMNSVKKNLNNTVKVPRPLIFKSLAAVVVSELFVKGQLKHNLQSRTGILIEVKR